MYQSQHCKYNFMLTGLIKQHFVKNLLRQRKMKTYGWEDILFGGASMLVFTKQGPVLFLFRDRDKSVNCSSE